MLSSVQMRSPSSPRPSPTRHAIETPEVEMPLVPPPNVVLDGFRAGNTKTNWDKL